MIEALDLSALAAGVHLLGHECRPVRLLREIQACQNALPGHHPHVEFWTHSQTNPAKVNCAHCWHDSPEVQHEFAVESAKRRTTH